MMRSFLIVVTLAASLALSAVSCGGGAPDADGLRDSFAQQLGANTFVTGFHRSGDDLTFSGPRAEGGAAKWRVHIDSAVVEQQNDERQPYKGTIKSSWFADDRPVVASRSESNLPIELLSNGLSQDAWAFWDPTAKRWSWE